MRSQRTLLVIALFCLPSVCCRAEEHVAPVCYVGPASQTQLRVSRHAKPLLPRRVLIVTGKNRQDRLHEQTLFAESLADHLRRSAFEVIVARDCVCEHRSPIRVGRFNENAILRVGKRHHADTVLYAEVTSIDAYDPMRVQATVALINVREAVSVVTAITTVDLHRAAAKRHYLSFARGHDGKAFEETFLHEPATLIDFTAHDLAKTLLQQWTEPPAKAESAKSGRPLR